MRAAVAIMPPVSLLDDAFRLESSSDSFLQAGHQLRLQALTGLHALLRQVRHYLNHFLADGRFVEGDHAAYRLGMDGELRTMMIAYMLSFDGNTDRGRYEHSGVCHSVA